MTLLVMQAVRLCDLGMCILYTYQEGGVLVFLLLQETKYNLGGEGLFHLMAGIHGSQDRNSGPGAGTGSKDHGETLLTCLCLMTYSACFFQHLGTTSPCDSTHRDLGPPLSVIKQEIRQYHSLAYRPI